MKKGKFRLFAFVLLTSLLLFVIGCTKNTEPKSQNEDIETIKAVLQNALTGPSDELKNAFNSDTLKYTVQYDKDHFEDYFANETAYLEFVNRYGAVLMIEPLRNDYNLKIKSIEFENTKSEEIVYDFSIDLEYQKEGGESSEVETLTGQANLNEEHKIEDMLIHIEDFWGSLDN